MRVNKKFGKGQLSAGMLKYKEFLFERDTNKRSYLPQVQTDNIKGNQYEWTDFYQKTAKELLRYKNKRFELLNGISEIFNSSIY